MTRRRLVRGPAALGRASALVIVWLAVALFTAAPAHAHAGGSPEASNYRVRVDGGSSPVPGVRVEVGTGGQWMRLTARGATSITVLGYAGEPFLRITQGHVWVNRRATTLADNPRLSPAALPRTPEPHAQPRWVDAGSGPSVAWSDRRLNGGDGEDGGDGGKDADIRTGAAAWRLPLRVDGEPVTITGTRTWEPPPSPWPWIGAIAAVGVAIAGVGRLRHWRTVTVALLLVAGGANIAHLVGVASTPQPGSALSAWGPALGTGALCWPLLIVAIAVTWRRSDHAGIAVAVAATVVAIFTAGDLPVLWHSQLAFAWPAGVERALVVATLGIAAGLIVTGLHQLTGASTGAPEAVERLETEGAGRP